MPTTYFKSIEFNTALFLRFNAKCGEDIYEKITNVVGKDKVKKTIFDNTIYREVEAILGIEQEELYMISPEECYFFHKCNELQNLCSFRSIEVIKNISAKMLLLPHDDTDNTNTLRIFQFAEEFLYKNGYFLADPNPNKDINLLNLLEKTYYDNNHNHVRDTDKEFISKLAKSGFYCATSYSPSICYCDYEHRFKFKPNDDPEEMHRRDFPSCRLHDRKIEKKDVAKIFDIVVEHNGIIESSNDFKVLRIISNHNCKHLYLIMKDIPEQNLSMTSIEKTTIAKEAIAEHAKIVDIIKYTSDNNDNQLLEFCEKKIIQGLHNLLNPELNENASTINISRYKILTQQAMDLLATFSDNLNKKFIIKYITAQLDTFKSHKNTYYQIIKIKSILLKELFLEKFNLYISEENKFIFVKNNQDVENNQDQEFKKIIADCKISILEEIKKILHIENEDIVTEEPFVLTDDCMDAFKDATVLEIQKMLHMENQDITIDIPFILKDVFIDAIIPAGILKIKQKERFTDEELHMLDQLFNILNDLYIAISNNDEDENTILINHLS